MTTLIRPRIGSGSSQSGRSATIWRYNSTAMRRLIVTIIALPTSSDRRRSQCSTMSRATMSRRSPAPTTASSRTHRDCARASQVVDVDVVTEDASGGPIAGLDRGPGEAEVGGIGQRIAQVLGQALAKAVLGSVRLIGNHDDIAPVGEHRLDIALGLRCELLDGGEQDPSGCPVEQPAHLGSVVGSFRSLGQHPGRGEDLPKSWSSRSLRSVMNTRMGLPIAAERMILAA